MTESRVYFWKYNVLNWFWMGKNARREYLKKKRESVPIVQVDPIQNLAAGLNAPYRIVEKPKRDERLGMFSLSSFQTDLPGSLNHHGLSICKIAKGNRQVALTTQKVPITAAKRQEKLQRYASEILSYQYQAKFESNLNFLRAQEHRSTLSVAATTQFHYGYQAQLAPLVPQVAHVMTTPQETPICSSLLQVAAMSQSTQVPQAPPSPQQESENPSWLVPLDLSRIAARTPMISCPGSPIIEKEEESPFLDTPKKTAPKVEAPSFIRPDQLEFDGVSSTVSAASPKRKARRF